MYNNYNEDYLMHYGVKGMKWGVRRARPEMSTSSTRQRFDSTKAAYKQAKKDYNKSFNKAYGYTYRHGVVGPLVSKKVREERDRRWDDAINKADALNKAKTDYKQAKTERRQAIRDTTRDLNKKASLGEKLTYNNNTRELAAKYMVDNNMSMADATNKAKGVAKRNTAIILGAYGAITVASLYANSRQTGNLLNKANALRSLG